MQPGQRGPSVAVSLISSLMFSFPLAAPAGPHSPSLAGRNHNAIQEAAGPSHVAINAISANMDSFARGRTAILKKQPSHMEAAHFGDLGTQLGFMIFMCWLFTFNHRSVEQEL